MDTQLIEYLRVTREVLVSRGRCRKALTDDQGRHCLAGAVTSAVTGIEDPGYFDLRNNAQVQTILEVLGRQIILRSGFNFKIEVMPVEVYHFNDDVCTTDEDVLALIDAVLALASADDRELAPADDRELVEV